MSVGTALNNRGETYGFINGLCVRMCCCVALGRAKLLNALWFQRRCSTTRHNTPHTGKQQEVYKQTSVCLQGLSVGFPPRFRTTDADMDRNSTAARIVVVQLDRIEFDPYDTGVSRLAFLSAVSYAM